MYTLTHTRTHTGTHAEICINTYSMYAYYIVAGYINTLRGRGTCSGRQILMGAAAAAHEKEVRKG